MGGSTFNYQMVTWPDFRTSLAEVCLMFYESSSRYFVLKPRAFPRNLDP